MVRTCSPSRRAFTLVPVVLLLTVTLIGLGIALGAKNANKPPPAGAMPGTSYARGYKAGGTFGPAIAAGGLGLFMIVAASGIAERRSHGLATTLCGGILLFAHLPYGLNLLGLAKPVPARTAQGQSQSPGTNPGPTTPTPSAPRPRPRADQPNPIPPPTDRPPAAVPPPRPAIRPAPAPAPDPEALRIEAAAKAATAAFEGELTEAIESTLASVEPLLNEVAKPPSHSGTVLRARADAVAKARDQLAALKSRLEKSDDDLSARLKDAGVPAHELLGATIRWSSGFRAAPRAFATDRLIDHLDRVKEECTALETHFAAWKLDKGEITTKDASLRHTLTSPRFFIESAQSSLPRTLDDVRGR